MNSSSRLARPLPCISEGMAMIATANRTGKGCTVTAGALACRARQIRQGVSEARGRSECAWVVSRPENTTTSKRQAEVIQRRRKSSPN